MLCKEPVLIGVNWYVPCGRCTPCLIGKRRLWADRIQLESTQHEQSAFLTLTYSEQNYPSDGSVSKVHVQDWLKRIRFRVEPLRLRYFAVGEYGSSSRRAHYHVALFGYPVCSRGTSSFSRKGHCCPHCDLVSETWGHGFVHSTPLAGPQARYISGYVTKKMTRAGHPDLEGRKPEFAMMSRKPGLGAWCAPAIAKALTESVLSEPLVDVPSSLRVGKDQHLLLGRYVRGLIREELGLSKNTPEVVVEEFSQKMLDLQRYARENGIPPKAVLVSLSGNRAARAEFFENLRKKRQL